MIIRNAIINDIDNNLLNIYIDGFRFHTVSRPDVFNINKTDEELKSELLNVIDDDEKCILVVEENNKIIGFIIASLKTKHGRVMWIDQVVVDKNARNRGIATILINKVKEIALKEQCDRLELGCFSFNDKANRLYKEIGFNSQMTIYEMKIK